MKSKKRNKKVPAYAFGMDQLDDISALVGLAGTGIEGLSDEGSGVNIAGSTIGGLGTGAAAGMAFGPIGAGIGAAVGGIGGALKSVFAKNKLKKEAERKRNRKNAALAANATSIMNTNYWDDNTLAYTYENGGILPDLAYLDNNEVVRSDDGMISKVPNTKRGTDNHLVDASNLESVLSDNIKRPGTNRTFAQEGEILTKMTKPSKGKDRFAEASNELNRRNANKKYNQLLAEQEAVKAKKGVKSKVKDIPAYEDGKDSNKPYKLNYGKELGKTFIPFVKGIGDFINSGLEQIIFDYNPLYQGGRSLTNAMNSYNQNHPVTLNPNKRLIQNYGSAPAFYDEAASGYTATGKVTNPYLDMPSRMEVMPQIPSVNTPEITPSSNQTPVKPSIAKTGTGSKSGKSNKAAAPKVDRITIPDENVMIPSFSPVITPAIQVSDVEDPTLSPIDTDTTTRGRYSSELLSLAPSVYNFFQGLRGPETEEMVTNPYTGSINRNMARRRMNINPAREANRRSRAIANYNAANVNPNTGSNLALRTQMAASEYANNADMYATKQNADNAYMGEYANMLNNLGQQWVQGQTLTNDFNARNRAAARNYTGSALSQLGQWSQVRRQEANQYNRDMMTLPFLSNFLSQGYTAEQVATLNNRAKNMRYGSK